GRPPDRPGQRGRPAARACRDLRRRDPPAGPRRPGPEDAGPGRPPRAGVGGRHPRGDRPGPVHRQLVHTDAGVRAGPRGRRARDAARSVREKPETERAGLAAPATPRQVLVGFAAETDTSPAAAQAKLARKGCDLLIVNPVGNGLGFGTPDNEAVVYASDGTV